MKNISFLFVIISCFYTLQVAAQKSIEVTVNHTIILNYVDYVVYADILTNERKVKPDLETFYYWYKANDIKKSRGGYEGKLLHGPYTEFYQNKNLKEKGNFRFGIKTGLWKSWHPNGELASLVNWKNGKMHGTFMLYDVSGNLLKKGKYKNDKLEGRLFSYSADEISAIERYKDGKLKVKKSRKNKTETDIIIKEKRRFSKIYFRRNRNKEKNNTDSLNRKNDQLKTNPVSPSSSDRKRSFFRKKNKVESIPVSLPQKNSPEAKEKKKFRLKKEKQATDNNSK